MSDPCFHPGYSMTRNYNALYDSPCVLERKPKGAPLNFTHTGVGNFLQCQEVVKNLFNFTSCKYSRCSFNGIFQPPLRGSFGVKKFRCLCFCSSLHIIWVISLQVYNLSAFCDDNIFIAWLFQSRFKSFSKETNFFFLQTDCLMHL